MSANANASKSGSRSFNIRDASVAFDDSDFIVEAFDSTLPFLASIGSGEMWGSILFSERPGFIEDNLKSVEQSEKYTLTGSGDAIRFLIASFKPMQP